MKENKGLLGIIICLKQFLFSRNMYVAFLVQRNKFDALQEISKIILRMTNMKQVRYSLGDIWNNTPNGEYKTSLILFWRNLKQYSEWRIWNKFNTLQEISEIILRMTNMKQVWYFSGEIWNINPSGEYKGTKLKATSHEEGHHRWKEHFQSLLENPPEITENLSKKFLLVD